MDKNEYVFLKWGLVVGSFNKQSGNSDVQPGLEIVDIKSYEFIPTQFEAFAKIKYLKASCSNCKLFQYVKSISISKFHLLKTIKSLQTFRIR